MDGKRDVRRFVLALLLAGLAVPRADGAPGGCETYDDRPIETGHTPAALPELSGLAASRRHPGIYWAHNDSGNAFVLYALRESGTVVASFTILGVTAVDPEDVGVGPCARSARRTCIFVADTGDNLRSRSRVQIVRVIEPDDLRSGPLIAQAFPFTYPDGAHDAEALLIDPRTAEAYVVTKSIMSLGDAYRVELTDGARTARAVHVASLSPTSGFDALVTAGSVHPSGTRLLLRTYRGAWELRRPDAPSLAEVLRTGTPHAVPSIRVLQGEAIAYTADGMGYLLGGEGDETPLARVGCRRP